MTTQSATKLLLAILLLALSKPCHAQQHSDPPECSTAYENRNQIDYGPLKVRLVAGAAIIQLDSKELQDVPGACFVLFTENDHKLVASAKADSAGRFAIIGVAPGRYRLIARTDGLCTANIPLELLKPSRRRKTEIQVHFQARGIDSCSYGELVKVLATPAPPMH
jgi:hypothetical protein